ncbi:alpha/beta fold hydrolase [Actinotalea fermentans]|uniref:Esterase n=1 Tax=Actinotalea fermentans TaxID=43671 RepID=A0A511Z1C0_9CELL|nr:alpha/beta hydrolase [Actinotalea fermentans]KGM15068.1 esterase [Actinotalea fermentans ATCC 43279 = JCM 9966 = DSM 3133]GEN81257.1 esterase [Actinotalea fermentans]
MTTTQTPRTTTHVVLVPGFWLGAWAWDAVVPALRDAGLAPHPVTLPGLGAPGTPEEPRPGITLDDQVAAVRDLVDGLDGDVVLVGHSGGAFVAQMVADQRPGRLRRVVYVDSGPLNDGMTLRPGDPGADVPLPTWAELQAEGSSLEGVDDDALATWRARAMPHPGGVATAPVHVHDARRFAVPVTAICTSLPSPLLRELIGSGQMPSELGAYADVEYVDLPTGHWPMFSRPTDLAAAIVAASRR